MKWKIEHTVIASWVALILVIVVLSVALHRSKCTEPNYEKYDKKIIELNDKINDYEKKALIQNTVIDNLDNEQLDSLWTRIHKNNKR